MELPAFLKPDYFKKNTVVGINVGAVSVKVAIMRANGPVLETVKTVLKEINPALEKKTLEAEIVSALKELLKSVNPRAARFVATVNCPETAVRRIQAPRIPKSELKDAIRLHASQYFPFPIEKSYLDFEWLGQGAGETAGKDNLLIATSPEVTVRRMMELLGKAGVRSSSVIVPTPLAIGRAFSVKKSGVLAILDVGFNLTELAILSGGELVFSRTIPVAGKDFTRAMTVSLATEKGRVQLTLEEAERIKRLAGIPAEQEAPRLVEDKILTTQILSMLRAPMELLTSEIERCFDYYREESGGGKIDSMLLCGGGAEMKGFDRALSAALGIEARLGENHRFEAALGAAMSGGDSIRSINLLPPEIKEETKRTFKRATLISAAAAAALFLVFAYVGMRIQFSNTKTKAATAEMELASLKSSLQEASEKKLAAELVRKEPYWEDIFREIARAVPQGVYLTRLRFQDKMLYLTGAVISGDSQAQITRLIQALEQGLFTHVRLVTARDGGTDTGNQFEIKFEIK